VLDLNISQFLFCISHDLPFLIICYANSCYNELSIDKVHNHLNGMQCDSKKLMNYITFLF